ncbi:hypothetical protein EDB86DRAFT_3247637 [Lactarius hatsudake]|nr:hypothetical protein EDB86DRAFT_3247637 [Lactarius hatsudake]
MAIRRMARVRDKGRVSRTRVRDNRDKGLEAPHMQVTCQGHVTANPSGPIPKAPGSGSRAGRGDDRSPRVSNTRSLPAAPLQRRFLRRREAKPLVASPTKAWVAHGSVCVGEYPSDGIFITGVMHRGPHDQGCAQPRHGGQGPLPLVLVSTQLHRRRHPCSGVVHHHCVLHNSEKAASTMAPKKAPSVARRLQLLQLGEDSPVTFPSVRAELLQLLRQRRLVPGYPEVEGIADTHVRHGQIDIHWLIEQVMREPSGSGLVVVTKYSCFSTRNLYLNGFTIYHCRPNPRPTFKTAKSLPLSHTLTALLTTLSSTHLNQKDGITTATSLPLASVHLPHIFTQKKSSHGYPGTLTPPRLLPHGSDGSNVLVTAAIVMGVAFVTVIARHKRFNARPSLLCLPSRST